MRHIDRYTGFEDLSTVERENVDYRVEVVKRQSEVAVIAPHGGRIETRTSEIARSIAGDDFNLYLFEGIKPSGNYKALHVTGHNFDEPRCLAMIRECPIVLAVHGFRSNAVRVLLGGLDASLRNELALSLQRAGIDVGTDGHSFPGLEAGNICNRGRSGRGLQLEISSALRGTSRERRVVEGVRSVLLLVKHRA